MAAANCASLSGAPVVLAMGSSMSLLSWAPGGDFLVALAGVLRVPFWKFLALVAIAKTARYCVVAGLTFTAFG